MQNRDSFNSVFWSYNIMDYNRQVGKFCKFQATNFEVRLFVYKFSYFTNNKMTKYCSGSKLVKKRRVYSSYFLDPVPNLKLNVTFQLIYK